MLTKNERKMYGQYATRDTCHIPRIATYASEGSRGFGCNDGVNSEV